MSELHVVALSGGKDSTGMALRLRFEAGDVPTRSINRELKEMQCRVCRI